MPRPRSKVRSVCVVPLSVRSTPCLLSSTGGGTTARSIPSGVAMTASSSPLTTAATVSLAPQAPPTTPRGEKSDPSGDSPGGVQVPGGCAGSAIVAAHAMPNRISAGSDAPPRSEGGTDGPAVLCARPVTGRTLVFPPVPNIALSDLPHHRSCFENRCDGSDRIDTRWLVSNTSH